MSATDRMLRVLQTLAKSEEAVGVVDLSEMLGYPPSAVHRALTTLGSYELVVQDPGSKKYGIGPSVLRLAHAYSKQNGLIGLAGPHLAQLAVDLRESVYLTEWIAGSAIVVAAVESPRAIRFYMGVGQRMPFHAAASARAILAHRPAHQVEEALQREALERYTESTPDTLDAARWEIELVRERGYAICDEEMEAGVRAVSVPIRSAGGISVASLSVIAPHLRLEGAPLDGSLKAITAAAEEMSRSMGFSTGTPPAAIVSNEHHTASTRRGEGPRTRRTTAALERADA